MDRLRPYRKMAVKVARNPYKAVYRINQEVTRLPAYVHTRLRTRELRDQFDRLRSLRRRDEYLLVVLDACRYDVFADVAPEYLTFETIEAVQSAGRNTFEYVSRCWPDRYDNVAYLSAATPINSNRREEYDHGTVSQLYGGYVPSEHLPHIRDVWSESWDESIGITPPGPVTDAALESDSRRVVAHYFQPHAPYIGRRSLLGHANDEDSRPLEGEAVDVPVWERVKYGDVSRARLRAVYESNLRRALREVARLVEATDIDTVAVMGDHGEALGEYGMYAHPQVDHPQIRTVPWGVVDGMNSYPDSSDGETTASSVESRLTDLGYL